MRSRKSSNHQAAEVARRRLELLGAELAAIRPTQVEPPSPRGTGGSGEPSPPPALAEPAGRSAQASLRPGRHARRSVTPSGSWTGWLQDRLPPGVQGRVRIGVAQVCAVAVAVAAAMGLLAWWSVRAADPGDLVPTRSTVAGGVAPEPLATPVGLASSSASAPGTPSASAEVVVDVAGKVRKPGIVRLPSGSRVVDALEAAGGARRGVDLSSLNLARLLVDGEQVLVGMAVPPGIAPSAASAATAPGGPAALVNLNTADQATLEELPGVGPVTAQAILQWRTENGAFTAVEELLEVSGIGDATLAEIAPHVTL